LENDCSRTAELRREFAQLPDTQDVAKTGNNNISKDWRFVSLVIVGLAFFAAGIFLRIEDRPRDFQPVAGPDLKYESFGIGLDPGPFTVLSATAAPWLRLRGGAEPGTVEVTFQVALQGHGTTQRTGLDWQRLDGTRGERPQPTRAVIVIVAPPGSEGFYLTEPSERQLAGGPVDDDYSSRSAGDGLSIKTSSQANRNDVWERRYETGWRWRKKPPMDDSHTVRVEVPANKPRAVAVNWHWRLPEGSGGAGIGRRNITIPLDFVSTIRNSDGVMRLEPDDYLLPLSSNPSSTNDKQVLDETLNHLTIEYTAGSGERLTFTNPDPRRAAPNIVQWKHEDKWLSELEPAPSYYLLTVEDQNVRFWVGILNEQTLFVAGLLLGAAMGVMAALWYGPNRAPNTISGRSS
jgi:hypothetical protein